MSFKDKETENVYRRKRRKEHPEKLSEGEKRYRIKNKEKIRLHRAKLRKENPESYREADKKQRDIRKQINPQKEKAKARNNALNCNYGITLKDYNLLLEKQNHKCAICESDNAGGRGVFHVDHDHETGKIRGLLCHKCNTGIGLLDDNIKILSKAINYLQN